MKLTIKEEYKDTRIAVKTKGGMLSFELSTTPEHRYLYLYNNGYEHLFNVEVVDDMPLFETEEPKKKIVTAKKDKNDKL